MRLADYTDYALHVLMYCAAHTDRLVTVAEIADRYAVSKNHLMKIVNDLGRQGLLETTRGRGDWWLAMWCAPQRPTFVWSSVSTRTDTCTLTPTCRLKHVLAAALHSISQRWTA
jgi:Rrf2 family transcriptional regulator, nitric oxide-sensitive transcriptional repressor